jgi:hypothetical protein
LELTQRVAACLLISKLASRLRIRQ